jgi:hypothetical protein
MGRLSQQYNLQAVNPGLAKEWHPFRNGDLTPRDVTPGSHRMAWWLCAKGHEWEAMIYSRNSGVGCPYCAGQAACEDNCLQTRNPELAKEWHPTKNSHLTPKDVTPMSHKKVWWICEKGHEWRATVANRSNGKGCPYCKGRLASKEYNLELVKPELGKDWHPRKNGTLTPQDVTPSSHKWIWWICDKGHEWQDKVSHRSRGSGCPYCNGRRRIVNELMAFQPSVALRNALLHLESIDLN